MVPYARKALGVNVATVPEYVTAPATAAPPGPATVKVVVLIEAALIAWLKVAVTVALMITSVVPRAGVTDTTLGTITIS
jgi:hypothetical protein